MAPGRGGGRQGQWSHRSAFRPALGPGTCERAKFVLTSTKSVLKSMKFVLSSTKSVLNSTESVLKFVLNSTRFVLNSTKSVLNPVVPLLAPHSVQEPAGDITLWSPLSSQYGTYKTVKARFWPCRSGKTPYFFLAVKSRDFCFSPLGSETDPARRKLTSSVNRQ